MSLFARFAPFALLLAVAPGCVVHTEDWPIGDDGDGSFGDVELYAEPSQAPAGDQALLQVWDNAGNVDFRQVLSVRALGDFDVVEWSGAEDKLELVVDVASTANGEQIFAIDFPEGSAFVTFDAY